jgi:hypothetical protein
MSRRPLVGATTGLSLLLALATAASPAFAHGQGHGVAGKITGVSSTSVTVQTQSGSVTEQLSSSTRVMKVTRGSLSDLAPGTFAQVTFASGTTTVTAIHIESKPVSSGHPTRTGSTHPSRPVGTSPTKGTRKPKNGSFEGGQVVSAGNGKLTLRNRRGQTATYTLSPNVTVFKTVHGQLSDLTVGQTVRIAVRRGSTTAFAVTIESA